MNLKGEMSMLNVLHLDDLDVIAIAKELEKKRDEMPQFFNQSPVVVDGSQLGDAVNEFDFSALKESLLSLGFIPVGVRNVPNALSVKLNKTGWAIMRESRKASANQISEKGTSSSSEQKKQAAPVVQSTPAVLNSLRVEKPVRSGQQIYAAASDMTVLAPTSAGSEIMADGSIHVYGALRGRVLAGAMGNESARIFCQSLQAELIAIAGRYQLLDESDTELKGKPAMIRLKGEKLIIEPLVI